MSTKEFVGLIFIGFVTLAVIADVFFSPVTSKLDDIKKSLDRLCEAVESNQKGG